MCLTSSLHRYWGGPETTAYQTLTMHRKKHTLPYTFFQLSSLHVTSMAKSRKHLQSLPWTGTNTHKGQTCRAKRCLFLLTSVLQTRRWQVRGSTKERGNWQEPCSLTDSTGHTRVNLDVLKHRVFFSVLWRNRVCFNASVPLQSWIFLCWITQKSLCKSQYEKWCCKYFNSYPYIFLPLEHCNNESSDTQHTVQYPRNPHCTRFK